MTEIKDSALPPAPLKGGPVLCLDIDGVSSPLGQDNRYDLHAPTPGLVPVAGAGHTMQVHPALPEWIAELEQAFAQCVWVSTWRESCRDFAECAGLQGAADWPYLMPVDDPPVPGPPFSSYKLEAVRAWVTPETPVAIVDDHLGGSKPIIPAMSDRETGGVKSPLFVRTTRPDAAHRPGQAHRFDPAHRGPAVPVCPGPGRPGIRPALRIKPGFALVGTVALAVACRPGAAGAHQAGR